MISGVLGGFRAVNVVCPEGAEGGTTFPLGLNKGCFPASQACICLSVVTSDLRWAPTDS